MQACWNRLCIHKPVMLDRLAMRALFWIALAVFAGAGGLLSMGASWHSAVPVLSDAIGALPAQRLLPTFGQAAPFLSLASLAIALMGWRLLHRELMTRAASDKENEIRARQLQEAMQANADGVFLMRAVRNVHGTITDFEIADVNASGAQLVHAERQHVIGRHLRRDFPEALSGEVFTRYTKAITEHTPIVEELRVNRRQFAGGWLHHQAVPTADGIAVTLKDISSRKREEMRLRRATLTDDLTSLYNRRGFLTLAEQQLRIARRQEKDAVLLYVDMDDFKMLNDVYGHAEGDRALAAVGRLLRRAVRDSDVVARLGGDEFTIMALDADRAAARIIQKRIEERVTLLNASGELAMPLSLTIGHTRVRPTDHATLGELLARADALLYARKKRRKLTSNARASVRQRVKGSLNRVPLAVPALTVPPDVAAIARAAAVSAAARFPTAANGKPFVPQRMA